MVQSVLSALVLGFRPLWGRSREIAGIQLFMQHSGAASDSAVDVRLLLRSLAEIWSPTAPRLLLSPQSRQMLLDLLAHGDVHTPWVEVQAEWLQESPVFDAVAQAQRRGMRLVWRGPLDQLPEAELARLFDNSLIGLNAGTALQVLRAAQQGRHPLIAGQMYEGIDSHKLVDLCLDDQGGWGVLGWPVDDVLFGQRHRHPQPAHATVLKLMKAIDADQSLETFEDILCEDPVLAYRFMTYCNSAALGLRTGISSLRRGLVMMGYTSIQKWLADQLPHADTEINMQPVRRAMVLRARMTERLLDAGVENELRREIYLCGLLSQIDVLMNDDLRSLLQRIPLAERTLEATLQGVGPYAMPVKLARALESPDPQPILQLCEEYELRLEDINRILLRTLSELRAPSR